MPTSQPTMLPLNRRYQSMDESEIGFSIGPDVGFVTAHSLCHGCGTCEAVCPRDAISMRYEHRRGIYLPEIKQSSCDQCTVCVQTCPGFELDLGVRPGGMEHSDEHPLIGPYRSIHRAFTNDSDRRERASSGGLITEAVEYLLTTGRVDRAILTRMSKDDPLKAQAYIASNRDELLASQKSKYCPVPLNTILKSLIRQDDDKRYVFVGLPHHVHGLRLAQRAFPHLCERIPIVISSFTAHVPSQRATEFVLYKQGIEPGNVASIEYRGGGNPGRMRIVTRDDREYKVPHLHWTYSGHSFPLFFYPVREWLYFDKLSEWADLSMGDNWMRGPAEQKGASTVVVRSTAGQELFDDLLHSNRITATPMTTDDLVADQELRTKLNIRQRLLTWKKLGRTIPVYSREFEHLKGQKLKTLRFALCVLLTERQLPFPLMDIIIKADYFLRAKPKKFINRVLRLLKRGLGMFTPAKVQIPRKLSIYKVVLIGGYGYYDIGDEAMPHAVRNNLRHQLGDKVEIMMLSPCPECTEEMHGERSSPDFNYISHGKDASPARKCFSFAMTTLVFFAVLLEKHLGLRLALWPNARSALDQIASADLIINVGGGNITTVITTELYKKTTTYIIADILGKPVFLSGQTMGPYHGWFARRYTRYALNKVKMISFRDQQISHDRLNKIGVTRPTMFDAADDAISLPGITGAEARQILQRETALDWQTLAENLLIVLNMKASLSLFKGQDRNSNLETEIRLLARLADALVERYECNIILLPTDFSEGVDDRQVHAQIHALVKHTSSIFQVTESYIDDELIGMIGQADVAIGARYHFNVFAASRHVPFLGLASGIYQRTKLKGLARLCETERCYIDHDMEYTDFGTIWPHVVDLVDNRAVVKRQLEDRVPQLKKNSYRVVEEAVAYLHRQT